MAIDEVSECILSQYYFKILMNLAKVEELVVYKKIIKSIYIELGESFHKHATETNLVRHFDKNQRSLGKDVVRVFIKTGFLRKHRTDTFSWTSEGLEYVKNILEI